MPNQKVSLQMYVKTAEGWRRYPAAYAKNGRVRPKYALVDGVPMHFPEGHYEIKYYKGRKTVQRNVERTLRPPNKRETVRQSCSRCVTLRAQSA